MWKSAFRALIGSYLRHERGRTALTVLGVALGVAVLVAIDLANESAVASFRRTVDSVAGSAVLTVRGNTAGIPGPAIATIAATGGVTAAAPLIEDNAVYTPPDSEAAESLLLLGVDFLRTTERLDEAVRDLEFELEEGRDIASLVTTTDALIFTRRFLEKHGLALGGGVELAIAGRSRVYTIAGVIDGGSIVDSVDGNVVVTDVGVADVLLQRGGTVDRVDLVLEEGVTVDEVAARLEERLPPSLVVERPETRGERVQEMIAAFRFNLRALGHISIVVGAFLVYNAMSIAVVRRRTAIGTLRAMGVSRGVIRGVFLLEGALVGLAGSAIGILVGSLMALAMLQPVSDAISINFFDARGVTLALSPGILLTALLVGVGGSVIAAAGPAREASSTPPANTMRRGTLEAAPARQGLNLAVGAVAAAVGIALVLREHRVGLPVNGYLASICFIVAFVAFARPALAASAVMARGVYTRLFGPEGLLAVSSTQASLGRASVAICGLMISVAMVISVSVMVTSFRQTVIGWMEQVLVADLYITAEGSARAGDGIPLPVGLAERIGDLPGVDAVDPFRRQSILLNGRPTNIGAGDLRVVRSGSRSLDGRPMQEVLRETAANREVVVSEAFALKQGVERGDILAIPTPHGPLELRINAVYRDFSSEQGYAIMDRSVYTEHFGETPLASIAVYLAPDADVEAVRAAIVDLQARVPATPLLGIRANTDLRRFALEAFDRTFAITYVLQVIAIVVAILGVITTLLAQILDRRHEMATLRYIGATRGRIGRTIVLESGLIGLVGLALGVANGLVLSYILTRVIMLESFGWTIGFEIPWGLVAGVAVGVYAVTLAAGILPAREAARASNRFAQTMAG